MTLDLQWFENARLEVSQQLRDKQMEVSGALVVIDAAIAQLKNEEAVIDADGILEETED